LPRLVDHVCARNARFPRLVDHVCVSSGRFRILLITFVRGMLASRDWSITFVRGVPDYRRDIGHPAHKGGRLGPSWRFECGRRWVWNRHAQVRAGPADQDIVMIVGIALGAWCLASLPLGILVGKLFSRRAASAATPVTAAAANPGNPASAPGPVPVPWREAVGAAN
jgi:hypothetical protein